MNANPFRITLTTLQRVIDENWSVDRQRDVTAYMWGLWDDADDLSTDLVGDSCGVTYEDALSTLTHATQEQLDDARSDAWDTDIHTAIAVCERLAPLFDALDMDDESLGVDMGEIRPDTTTLPTFR